MRRKEREERREGGEGVRGREGEERGRKMLFSRFACVFLFPTTLTVCPRVNLN